MPEKEARDRSPKSPRWSAERRASLAQGTQGASQAPGVSEHAERVPRKHPTFFRRSAHPSFRVREAKGKPRAQKRAAGTKRCCLGVRLSVGHSGRGAIAARAGIHNHWPWVWIPGSRALPAPRNDARETRRGNEEVLLGANAFSCSFRPSRDTARAGMMRRSRRCPSLPADSGLNSAPRAGTTSAPPEGRATSAPFFCAQRT